MPAHTRMPLWGKLLLLIGVFCFVATLYAVFRDPHAPQVSLAPKSGAAPVPDSPSSSTVGRNVPHPGDRATGTIPRSGTPTAPPPVRPARPVIKDGGSGPGGQ